MAQTTFSTRYQSAGVPTPGRPFSAQPGDSSDSVTGSWATTDLDTIADLKYLIPVMSGKRILYLDLLNFADLGSGELDMDLVLITTDKLGTVTTTILYNAGTAFATAQTAGVPLRIWCDVVVPESATNMGHICSLVNVAAVTPIAGTGVIYAKIQSF